MKGISMEDTDGLKKGDFIRTKYLSHVGEVITSQKLIFQRAFLRGKNMVVIEYKENGGNKVYEMSSILSIEKI